LLENFFQALAGNNFVMKDNIMKRSGCHRNQLVKWGHIIADASSQERCQRLPGIPNHFEKWLRAEPEDRSEKDSQRMRGDPPECGGGLRVAGRVSSLS
jgi:hypothetical protein